MLRRFQRPCFRLPIEQALERPDSGPVEIYGNHCVICHLSLTAASGWWGGMGHPTMAMLIHLDIVSAESAIFSGQAEMIFAPAVMGEVGVAPRHAPLVTRLKPGEVRVNMPGGGEQSFYVSGGILEIQPHVVTILSDTALRAHDIDEAEAIAARERAEQAMHDHDSEMEYAAAEAALAEATAQLALLKRLKR